MCSGQLSDVSRKLAPSLLVREASAARNKNTELIQRAFLEVVRMKEAMEAFTEACPTHLNAGSQKPRAVS